MLDGVGEVDSTLQTVGVFVAGAGSNGGGSNCGHGSGSSSHGVGCESGSGSGTGSSSAGVCEEEDREYARGIVYYLRGGVVVGAALWNCGEHLERARALVREQLHVFSPTDLKRAISIAPDAWVDVIVQDA